MIIYKDIKNNFIDFFNPQNGFRVRSTILDSDKEPLQRDFPELIDIGIMGECHIANENICTKAGIDCYQSAQKIRKSNMALIDYKKIIKQCKNKTFQVALGGAGDPNKHENIEDILKYTRECGIVPNITTTGIHITDREIELIKKYCGAVAVSFYSRLVFFENYPKESNLDTLQAIDKLTTAGCSVNIHYVISKNTIDEAIYRLNNDLFPKGINAIIFILYKPVGLGKNEKVLTHRDMKLLELLDIVQKNTFRFKIGFDTCCTPLLVKHSSHISISSIDFCEAARFSMYIDCECFAYPCSFDCYNKKYRLSAKSMMIKYIWDSNIFEAFRIKQLNSCPQCGNKLLCLGGCALNLGINLCGEKF